MVEKVLCMDLRTNALLTGWLYVISSWLALVIGILLIIMDDKIATLIIDFNPPLDYHDMLRIRRMLHCEFHNWHNETADLVLIRYFHSSYRICEDAISMYSTPTRYIADDWHSTGECELNHIEAWNDSSIDIFLYV